MLNDGVSIAMTIESLALLNDGVSIAMTNSIEHSNALSIVK